MLLFLPVANSIYISAYALNLNRCDFMPPFNSYPMYLCCCYFFRCCQQTCAKLCLCRSKAHIIIIYFIMILVSVCTKFVFFFYLFTIFPAMRTVYVSSLNCQHSFLNSCARTVLMFCIFCHMDLWVSEPEYEKNFHN